MTGGGVQMEQLPGVMACQSDDVIRHNWHGMLQDVFYSNLIILMIMELEGRLPLCFAADVSFFL